VIEFLFLELDDPPLARAWLNLSLIGRFLDAPISILNFIVSFGRPEPGRRPLLFDPFALRVELHTRGTRNLFTEKRLGNSPDLKAD